MKIIALDDEDIMLEHLCDCIREAEPEAEVIPFKKSSEVLEYAKKGRIDIAFLDIEMRGMLGTELAKKLKTISPKTNIIFATGYKEYQGEAFDMHVSGYLMKPINTQKVRKELNELRFPLLPYSKHKVRFQCFGNFEVFVEGKPINFHYEKTKEMLAYLVDSRGASCSNDEIMSALWQDEKKDDYLRHIRKDLFDTMRMLGCDDIFEKGWGKLAILSDRVDCDYYDYLRGEIYAINAYKGEYMKQRSWPEYTNGTLIMKGK